MHRHLTAGLALLALASSACASDRSEIVVQNRTTVPISLRSAASETLGTEVPACGSVTIRSGESNPPGSPDPRAVVVVHPLPAAADAATQAVVVISSRGASDSFGSALGSLPPCEGAPPPPS